MTGARSSWLVALAFGCACSSKDAPVGPPGLRDSSGRLVAAEPAPAAKPAATAAVRADDGLGALRPLDFGDQAPPGSPVTGADNVLGAAPSAANELTADAGATPTRDLVAELSALLDPHGACLDLAAAAASGGRLVLSATVSVLPGGRIMRATVSAPGQPPDVRACLEQRLLSAQLQGPIPGAPRNIDGTVIVEVSPGRGSAAPRPAPPVGRPPAADLARPDPGETAKPDPGDVAGAP